MIEQNIDIKIDKNKWDPILVSLFESEQEKKEIKLKIYYE